MSATPPTYRARLRLEGSTLAGFGALGSALLLALADTSTRAPLSTVGQLAVLGALLAIIGPRATAKALREARGMRAAALGSGEPTPLWQLPLIVAGLALGFGALAGWDAALRVTCGCLLVGLFQALLVERLVARAEAAGGRSYHRVAGSRIGRGTRLGYAEDNAGAAP